jgi:hypothetical protein
LRLVPRIPRRARPAPVAGPFAPECLIPPFAFETNDESLPRAVFFHDSYGAHLAPYLSEHFERSVFAWQRADFPVFDAALVERERPQIVIQQIVERKLAAYCPDGAGIARDPRGETVAAWTRCSEAAD